MLRYRYPRWKISPDIHAFLLQGTDVLHLVYLPNFFKANNQRQVILTGRLVSAEAMNVYRTAYRKHSQEPLVIFTSRKEVLQQILKNGSFFGDIYHGRPERYQYVFITLWLPHVSHAAAEMTNPTNQSAEGFNSRL